MKPIRNPFPVLTALLFAALSLPAAAATYTAGTNTFTITFVDPAGNYNKRVDAFWVTDATGRFVQNLRKDAKSEQKYLYQWAAARKTTVIDGFSGATISTWTPVTVTWDCRDTNEVVVPDGTYKIYVEFTDRNSQGPWTTNGISFVKGPTAFTNTYPGWRYLTNMTLVFKPSHDLAVIAIAPATAPPNTNATVRVTVTNKTDSVETFSLLLSNVTSKALIGTQTIGPLAGRGVTNVAFRWNTTNLSGAYTLRATAGPVAGETITTNNTLSASVLVEVIAHDLAVTGITPNFAPPNSTTTLYVGVTNQTASPESFSVTLSNLTAGALIGTQAIASLAGNRATNVAFTWNTGAVLGDQFLMATAGPVPGETVTADNTITNLVTVRLINHDVGIAGILAPALVWPNSASNLTVIATNAGEVAESFSVQLFDDTAALAIGSARQITNLAAFSATHLSFTWTMTNGAFGNHTLRAVASSVAGETALANNTNTTRVMVANGWTTNTLIARGSAWRFHDRGLDLTDTPWPLPDYPDSVWGQGAAPLGYSQDGQLTDLATLLSWGPDATNKYPASYLRQDFYADILPASLKVSARRVDGVVVYLNGAELARFNMPADPVTYSTLASNTVTGENLSAFFTAAVVPTNMIAGKNTLAAEIHRASLTGSNLVFDLEVLATVPQIPAVRLVDATGLSAESGGIVGDQVPIAVTVTNRGNRTETVQVFLQNDVTGQIVGSRVITGLGPAGSATAQFKWGTLGALGGVNTLSAYTVVGGVTNFAGAITNAVVLGGTGFVTNIVNVTGAIGGRCAAVAATGQRLLVGAGATLEVWNRADPARLAKLGQVRLPGLIEGIAAQDTFAFVACGNAGVQFVDLSSPTSPLPVMTFDTSGHAYGVAVSGNLLFVADGLSGLRILNVAVPAAPTLAGSYFTEGPARAVAVAGGRIFLVDAHRGLLVLDAANPTAPTLLGACAFHAGQAVAVAGSTAFVVDANNHFLAIDVSAPSAPRLIGSLLVPAMIGQSVLLNGSTAYVPALDLGLLVLNVATPSAPALVRSVPVPAQGQSVGAALVGTNLFLANSFAGFQVFEVATPDNPVLQSDWPTSARACQVAVNNTLACLAAGENGLRLYRVANPASPVWIGWLTNAMNARCVALDGDTAVVGDGQYGLKVVNVADPATPMLLGSWSGPDLASVRNIGLTGAQALASDGRTLGLFDLSTPASPTLVATYTAPAFVFDLVVSGARAYLACGNAGLVVLNLGANSLTLAGTFAGAGFATGVSVSGTNAFLANGPGGWSLLDVSGPAPVLVTTRLTEGPVADVAVAGVLVTLGNGLNLATTLDVTAPLTPVPQRSFNALIRALNLTASAGLVFAAEDEAGVAIGTVSADVDHDGLPDVWEQQIVDADPNDTIRTIWDVNPNDDFDGDGASNHAEYLAGTSPIDRGSRFLAFMSPVTGGAAPAIQWTSVAGRIYTIHKTTNLQTGFTVLLDNIAATPPLNTFVDPAPSGAAFYIISVR